MRKLQDSEAARLAAFILRWARPAGAEAERECEYWVKRLEGKRS